MQKIRRKWISSKEMFQEYAIDKLSIIYNLDFPPQDTINLLIGGITNEALRAMAAMIRTISVKIFQMCQLAATVGLRRRKRLPWVRSSIRHTDIQTIRSGKRYHLQELQ